MSPERAASLFAERRHLLARLGRDEGGDPRAHGPAMAADPAFALPIGQLHDRAEAAGMLAR
jgi:hypothetical protein